MNIQFLAGPLPLAVSNAIRLNATLAGVRSALTAAGFNIVDISGDLIVAHSPIHEIAIKHSQPAQEHIEDLMLRQSPTKIMIYGSQA